MRRLAVAPLSFALLAACADGPTAPAIDVPAALEAPPSEIVATSNTLFELGSLTGFASGGVNAINGAGETAGWNNLPGSAYHAFVRELDGTMTDLGTLGGSGSIALGLNDASTAVGLAYVTGNGTYHAFASAVAGAGRTIVDLPVLSGTAAATARCAAYGINSGGTAVGFCFAADGKQHAVRWTRNVLTGAYAALDLQPATGWTSTFAYDVNDAGTVVGFGVQTSGAVRGFKYVPGFRGGGTMTAIGTFPGGGSSTLRAINNNGDVVGWGTTSTGAMHALGIYVAAPTTVYDGGASLPGPSYAFDINDNGQAVGWSQPTTGVYQPLYWDLATTPVDLGTFTTATSGQALAVNERGQVVGTSGSLAAMWFTTANTDPVANPGGAYSAKRLKAKPVAVTLDGSGSVDPDGDLITSYSWTFSDGGAATGRMPTHSFKTAGRHTATLEVKDWRGGTSAVARATVMIR